MILLNFLWTAFKTLLTPFSWDIISWMKSWDWQLLLVLVPCTNRYYQVSRRTTKCLIQLFFNYQLTVTLKCWQHVHPETLVWSDEFDTLDESKWTHLVTTHPLVRLWRIVYISWHLDTIQDDFQYYRNHRSNSWVSEGALHVMPTLTASEYGEDFLHNGCIDLNKEVSELSPPGTCHLSNYCSAPWFHF